MALDINITNFCNDVSLAIIPISPATSGKVTITSLTSNISKKYSVTFSGPTTNLVIASASLPNDGEGAYMVKLEENGETTHSKAMLIHCNIDCCLTKLTNELLACDCDCPRCSKALAKAQKVYLLLQSAIAKVDEVNSLRDLGNETGYFDDIQEKYKKAKEICDGSCGCDC